MDVANYRAVLLTKRGAPEVLKTVELPVREPLAGEVRVMVLACGCGATDITMRRGYYPYAPKIPFVPGYDVVGVVDAVGEGVTDLAVGDRVCALTVHGGYAEVIYRDAVDFVRVPDGLDDAEVVALILNYVTAYQMIHRVAKQSPGQTALVTGANGVVGQALLELLTLAGVQAFGAASSRHHDLVRSLGATPIESREGPIDARLRQLAPQGVDAAYDALGGRFVAQCLRSITRGGILVAYGFSSAAAGPDHGPANLRLAGGFFDLFVRTPLTGRRAKFYGITALYRKDRTPLREDLPVLFDLLARGQITPTIAARLPLLDARHANELLEAGGVNGKIVLVRGVTTT
jgi:NADPH:quinone reductase-like Zn-dependent oxidoreductase